MKKCRNLDWQNVIMYIGAMLEKQQYEDNSEELNDEMYIWLQNTYSLRKKKLKLKAKQKVVMVKPTKKHVCYSDASGDYFYQELSKAMQATEIVGRGKKTNMKGKKIVKVESIGDMFPGMMNEENDD